jgi:hypothetical protein
MDRPRAPDRLSEKSKLPLMPPPGGISLTVCSAPLCPLPYEINSTVYL